jgi:pimeloyl-ACP methyl ester carboxylesterase
MQTRNQHGTPDHASPGDERAAADRADATAVGATLRRVTVPDAELQVAVAGDGPTIVLVHGWPHTWHVWHRLIPTLARTHRVLAPDLRGAGGSSRARDGYDLHTLAGDLAAVVAAHGDGDATVVGIDAGAPVAWMAAATGRVAVRRLVLVESLLGRLPGAEAFLAGGPPWWFGLHAIPGLAEDLVEGREERYLDWFLTTGTADGRGVAPASRRAFLAAYRGAESLRCGFEHYRAMPRNAGLIERAVADPTRVQVPTLAVGAGTVGDALHRQLAPITDRLEGHVIPDCGHIVPEDRPEDLLRLILDFEGGSGRPGPTRR